MQETSIVQQNVQRNKLDLFQLLNLGVHKAKGKELCYSDPNLR